MIVVSDIWAEALSILSGRLQAISFEVWIEKLEPLCFTQNRLILLANSQSSKKTIENKYLDTIKEAVTEVNALITDVIIITENQKEKYLKEKDYIFNNELVVSNKKPVKDNGFSFSKKYTFDTFVVGKSNEIAVAAAQTVAEHPGGNFNPLFLYGGVGLGKTHLMHAIGNYIKEHSPHLKILYTTAEKFTSDFINSINQNKVNKSATAEFKEKVEEYKAECSNDELKDIIAALSDMGPDTVIITGAPVPGQSGLTSVIARSKSDLRTWKVTCPYLPAHYPGTGDSFTSVITGSLLQGDSLPIALDRAAQFILQGIRATFGYQTDSRDGILLERVLPLLNMPIQSASYELI